MSDQPQRQIDLNREDELVPWSAWFRRASESLRQFHGVPEGTRPIFRVTLIDGRVFAVTHVQTHVSRGKCMVGEDRWGNTDAICDVITGYTLAGRGMDGRPTALVIPPDMIASVECVLVAASDPQPDENSSEETVDRPFGFAAYRAWDGALNIEEVEDNSSAAAASGGGTQEAKQI